MTIHELHSCIHRAHSRTSFIAITNEKTHNINDCTPKPIQIEISCSDGSMQMFLLLLLFVVPMVECCCCDCIGYRTPYHFFLFVFSVCVWDTLWADSSGKKCLRAKSQLSIQMGQKNVNKIQRLLSLNFLFVAVLLAVRFILSSKIIVTIFLLSFFFFIFLFLGFYLFHTFFGWLFLSNYFLHAP